MDSHEASATHWLLSTVAVIGLMLASLLLPELSRAAQAQSSYVIQVSIDGLGSEYLKPLLAGGQTPNLARLVHEGASTMNARADYDYTITLPNHTSMLTGRPVSDKFGDVISGHHWTTNTLSADDVTLHSNRGFYVAGVFDVAHDHGLSTALYASKAKFVLYDNSWNAVNGALDDVAPDNGRDKIDTFVNIDLNATAVFSAFRMNELSHPARYVFIHFDSPDTAGHVNGWGSAPYTRSVMLVDGFIGQLFSMIDQSVQLRGNTYLVLTADHGGTGFGHSDAMLAINYTVPFVVWGPGIPTGADLYALTGSAVSEPGTTRVDYGLDNQQPIRNGDAGNCALRLLGLPAIPGSRLDHLQNVCQLHATMQTFMSIIAR